MPYKDKDKRNEYARKWIAKRRADWFADKSCVRCGSTDRLEMDHIDPALKVAHQVWSWTQVRRDEELAKCQVLCYLHHKEKSAVELSNRWANHRTDGTMCQVFCPKCRTKSTRS